MKLFKENIYEIQNKVTPLPFDVLSNTVTNIKKIFYFEKWKAYLMSYFSHRYLEEEEQ